METPDKIYVTSYNGEAFSHSWTFEPLGDTTATEYIRKDALLKWAKRMKSICKGAEPIVKAYKTVIDKLNSM